MQEDDLLLYYQQELAFIRRLGEQFADAHPKIAGHLRLGPKTVEDPHVARLMEAFALGNARIRYKIDEDLPEITDSLLMAIHPHALSPIPSMSVVQFQLNPGKLTTARTIPADTALVTEEVQGGACVFKTRYPAQLLPIKINHASLAGKPIIAPIVPAFADAVAILRISLSCQQPNLTFSAMGLHSLRFFINAQTQYAYALHELLFNRVSGIALARVPNDPQPIILNKNCLQAVGFHEHEGMLPYSKRVFTGYRLLTEYFVFPEKFLFFDLAGLEKPLHENFVQPGGNLEIYFYLNQLHPALEKNLNADFFALGCAPVVNLFEKIAEPMRLTHTKTEYHLIPDAARLPETTEVYEVTKVTAHSENGEAMEYLPFYGIKRGRDKAYFHLSRKPAWQAEYYPVSGTEIFLSFTDLQGNALQPEKWIVNTELLCTNRDLPMQLPFGGGQPFFKFVNNKLDAVKQINCLTPITPAYRPLLKKGAKWRYITHLQLNHLSLTDDEQGIEALRELIRIYNFNQGNEIDNLLDGLLEIRSRQILNRRTGSPGNPFWRGIEISLSVDERKFSGSSLYLFGCILDYFFSLYVTLNSFTQLVITSRQGEIYRFSPRVGEKLLI